MNNYLLIKIMPKYVKIRFRKYFKKKKPKRNRRIDKRKESIKSKKETNEVTHGRETEYPKKALLFPQQDAEIKKDWDEDFNELDIAENNFDEQKEENSFDLDVNINQS